MSHEIGQIAWKQIPVMTKMAVGAREPILRSDEECHLSFKVLRAMRYVEIRLEGDDTYTVRLIRHKRSTYERITVKEESGIYCDMLGESVYRVCH